MEPASKDYLSVADLSKPRLTPLQIQLQKIDPSIIKDGTPSSRSHRRGYARQRTEHDLSLFEISVLAFREIIFKRLWKSDHRYQNESEFCKHQWGIAKPRKALLIECAELLTELSTEPVRPCSEQVCKALTQASVALQPSALQRTSIAPELWRQVLRAWRVQYRISSNEPVDVENMSADFVDSILLPQASSAPNPQPVPTIQIHAHSITPHQEATSTLSSGQPALPNLDIQHQVHLLPHSVISTAQNIPGRQPTDQHPQPSQQAIAPERPPKTRSIPTSHSGVNSSAAQPSSPTSQASILTSASQPEPFRERVAHLLMDERRFHAPLAVLERVQRFFNGSLQLDPAAFEGSTVKAMISVPFPDIMDTDGWRVPVGFGSNSASAPQSFAPMQSCFLHVPILPSKRRFETETEVIFLDDVRLAGQLNSKLWEEFSNGNVEEAISLVPTSATWFGRTELADWPCVVMSGLKFEQANGMDPSGKKYAEVHSYIAVYLGRDPLRQAQFVRTFQDLGISPPQNPESLMGSSSTVPNASQSNGGQHRWIAGFRRLFRTHTSDPGGPRGLGYGPKGAWHPSHDDADDESIDPQFDDIYSILPPHKKPRLERAGRPSDAQAAWHHSKRRKMEEEGFSKLKDHNLDERKWGREDDMSE
ncbi:hypothetical protein BC939DRAFT_458252 [Gamsiella multidivaricata]|uniref:uncharacterized protein n=1 Tax=Gamsiella multidivaricata TaxID=101098 RepID=UPI0022207AC9|nr:uncharacterized protein BC939DRAFT_458252 [Gamsiella multidivaricata]KAI7820291.1 hypothetical protein BC939DRAFT_458252 [Gamsiella multidivaricata]